MIGSCCCTCDDDDSGEDDYDDNNNNEEAVVGRIKLMFRTRFTWIIQTLLLVQDYIYNAHLLIPTKYMCLHGESFASLSGHVQEII